MNNSGFKRLEDYGVIGNLETCALVGKDGSIDWCCLPYMHSPSVFGAILDVVRGGAFQISPKDGFKAGQAYVGTSNVLKTTFDSASGSVNLIDFMPVIREDDKAGPGQTRALLRNVQCIRGSVRMALDFSPRFDYGRVLPEFDPIEGGLAAKGGGLNLFLQSPAKLDLSQGAARGSFNLKEGESYWFALVFGWHHHRFLERKECEELLDKTVRYWIEWLHASKISRPLLKGPWHDLVIRSALVLKLLSNSRTGAIAAAPTTSLPETLGGMRNWDYRYSWLRDASFTIQAFEHMGHIREALNYFKWLKSVCYSEGKGGNLDNIKIVYSLHGEDIPEERNIDYLSGYMNSSPVRVGNAASAQRQLDIYGEIVNTFYMAKDYEKSVISTYWEFIRAIADYVCSVWDKEDSGIWEFRIPKGHLTHSKLMCWVALDRSIGLAKQYKLQGSVEKWKEMSETIRKAILERGFSMKLNSFVQSFDSEQLDATSLLIPVLGLLSPKDPKVLGTIDALENHLSNDGLLYRYAGDDGIPGKEGTFTLCSFWMVEALALSGEVDRAEQTFLKILKYKSPLGLFSEEIDPRFQLQIGNYPQAISHIGLINAALYLGNAQRREGRGPKLMGEEKPKEGSEET